MDLNLFSLKVFLKVAEVRSFTKAAEDLFLSQPAVSLQIQKLEQQFQLQFFVRPHSGRIRLTQAGEALKPHVERMIQLHDSILISMSRYSPALQKETSLQKTTSTHVEKTTHRRSSVVAELLRLLP
jgi:DNA-binding transcriptional LysR family regulator